MRFALASAPAWKLNSWCPVFTNLSCRVLKHLMVNHLLLLNHILFCFFSAELCMNFPEEFRPLELVNFDDVIPCSARENRASVNCLKQRLRELLDFYGDQERNQATVVATAKEKVKKQLCESSNRLTWFFCVDCIFVYTCTLLYTVNFPVFIIQNKRWLINKKVHDL